MIGEERGGYEVVCGPGQVWLAQLPGGERWSAPLEKPAVGDWVWVERFEGLTLVRHRFERTSCLVRKGVGGRGGPQIVGANLDKVFVVSSLNRDFNVRRLERLLAAVWSSGAEPVVVLTKADLCEDPHEAARAVNAVQGVSREVPVEVVSAHHSLGRERLQVHLGAGVTVGLVGSSGVGKSTLVNWLMGQEIMETSHVRQGDSKGRHTTTGRHLLVMPRGRGVLMDTPGMREFGVWNAAEGVERVFGDIEVLAGQCRFRDCEHNGEPGCAVQAALDAGELSDQRLYSYQKLRREAAYQARREDDNQLATHLERKRRRRFAKMVRRKTKGSPKC